MDLALATAQFLHSQRPHGSAYVVGEAGLTTALHEVGYRISEIRPDYVVLGETRAYSFDAITRAIRLILAGARFIATNPDPTGPTPDGLSPATGSVAALITAATRVQPYFVGKPNPLMMRSALNALGAHSEVTVMIGDRMDTDIFAGMEAGMHTVLVLTGVTDKQDVAQFPYQPWRVVRSIADPTTDGGIRTDVAVTIAANMASKQPHAESCACGASVILFAAYLSESALSRLTHAASLVPARLIVCPTTSDLAQLVERQHPAVVIVDSLSCADVREALSGAATSPALVAWCGYYTSEASAVLIESGVDEVLHPGMLDVELAARLRHCACRWRRGT